MNVDRIAPTLAAVRRSDRLHGQLLRFVLVGGLSTILDGAAYRLLLAMAVGTSPAKGIGYLVGMSCSIAFNYRWTFGRTGPGRAGVIVRCVLLYLTALIINVAANRLALAALPVAPLATMIAFLAAVGISTVYNFVGMRFWIFRGASPLVA